MILMASSKNLLPTDPISGIRHGLWGMIITGNTSSTTTKDRRANRPKCVQPGNGAPSQGIPAFRALSSKGGSIHPYRQERNAINVSLHSKFNVQERRSGTETYLVRSSTVTVVPERELSPGAPPAKVASAPRDSGSVVAGAPRRRDSARSPSGASGGRAGWPTGSTGVGDRGVSGRGYGAGFVRRSGGLKK